MSTFWWSLFPQESILIVALSCLSFIVLRALVWTAVAHLPKLEHHEKDEITAKIASTAHAVVASVSSVVLLFLDSSSYWDNRILAASSRMIAVVAISCGYFAYDLIWLVAELLVHYKFSLISELMKGDAELVRKMPYLFHHLACFLVYSLCLSRSFCLLYLIFFLSWEISTPFLNVRWILLKFTNHDDAAAKKHRKLIDIFFGVLFLLCRNVIGNWVTYTLWGDILPLVNSGIQEQWFMILMLGCSFTLSGLNVYWGAQIVQAIVGGTSKRASTKSH